MTEETKPHTLGPRTLAEMEPHTFALQDHPAHPGMTCDQYRLELVQMRNARWTPDEAGTEETKPSPDTTPTAARTWHKHSDEAGDRGPTESAGAYLERHLISQHGFSPSEASGNVADLTRAHQADHDGLHVFAGRNHPAHPGLNCHEYETMPSTWDTPPPSSYDSAVVAAIRRSLPDMLAEHVADQGPPVDLEPDATGGWSAPADSEVLPYEAGTVIVLSEAQAAALAERCLDTPSEILHGGAGSLRSLAAADRNARAYGWEIGRGQPLGETVKTTEGNPFLDAEWREGRISAAAAVQPAPHGYEGYEAPFEDDLTGLLDHHNITARGVTTPALAEFLVRSLIMIQDAVREPDDE